MERERRGGADDYGSAVLVRTGLVALTLTSAVSAAAVWAMAVLTVAGGFVALFHHRP